MRVLAALSGGVDSAVAAALALEAGHEVAGVHLGLANGCTSDDATDARHVADSLGISCDVWDLSEEFERLVLADFLAQYAAGRTPNPCVRCNDQVKFGVLVDQAAARGFDAVCTGHYAQVTVAAGGVQPGQVTTVASGGEVQPGQVVLRRGAYIPKDQSYVLAAAGPARLAHAMFPLGVTTSKDEVRALAAARGLPVATKGDSLDLCFVPDGDLRGYLRERLGPAPGEIVETDGTVVGHHDGTYGFTIGQRRGLHIGRPATDGHPRYVVALDPATRQVVVGPAQALDVKTITATTPVWFAPEPSTPTRYLVQVRAHADPVPAMITSSGTTLTIHLDTPLRGVAPGQSAVCYDADRVVVQATITAAIGS
ncbi:MAG: tRNA 2-thiouridine(34) synthase MnmA [Micrococcales bacterium]|nr:tRNA 2-thiouridine(34) synthase MnmA [Micrococcales bacterium]